MHYDASSPTEQASATLSDVRLRALFALYHLRHDADPSDVAAGEWALTVTAVEPVVIHTRDESKLQPVPQQASISFGEHSLSRCGEESLRETFSSGDSESVRLEGMRLHTASQRVTAAIPRPP